MVDTTCTGDDIVNRVVRFSKRNILQRKYSSVALAIRAGDWESVKFMIDEREHFDMRSGLESLHTEDLRVFYSLMKKI